MAPSTRRSTRRSSTAAVVEDNVEETEKDTSETCPACENGGNGSNATDSDKAVWIRCDACKVWFHWACVGDQGDHEQVDKWFCTLCQQEDSSRVNTLKPIARKSARRKTKRDYASMNDGLESDVNRWIGVLETKPIHDHAFPKMKGADVTVEWLESDDNALREPILIEKPEGLGMKMPPKSLTVQDVASLVGEETPVDVIDVVSQSNSPHWTLGKWAEYYATAAEERDRIRNVISLEVSGTKLAEKIVPPQIVRDIDWVDKFWPQGKKQKGSYPKVQLYCLMSVANCWTDWHIDFAGSSVYYHIFKGSKVFYFIKPTVTNLAAYEKWSGTEMQNTTWLGDLVDRVVKVELQEGNTMIIPTGWIHAVYTPSDSIVFGGNFLHSYNVATQIRVREIEIATRVPKKFTFPLFQRLCWYVGERYLRDLKAKEEFSRRVLESIDALASFLVSECRIMDRSPDNNVRKDTRDHVPNEKIKDPAALARELRWRVRMAAGGDSGDELAPIRNEGESINGGSAEGNKRKREHGHADSREGSAPVKFKHWAPKPWDTVEMQPLRTESAVIQKRKPGAEELNQWVDEEVKGEEEGNVEQVNFETRTAKLIRMRRIGPTEVERETVTRVVDLWTWPDTTSSTTVSNGHAPMDEGP